MIIWRIVKASLPIIILPAIIIGFVLKYFGFTLDSLLVIIFLGQCYIIWGQLEVALRQTHLSFLEYEPEFKIEVKKSLAGIGSEFSSYYELKLQNIGKHLARNVFVLIESNGHRHKFIPLTNVAPNEIVALDIFDDILFNKSTIKVNVDYQNVLGKDSGIFFVKESKLPEFIVIKSIRMPGVLLNSLEDMLLIFRLFTFSRRIKSLKEKTEK
jgi:hypothetical protein